MKDIHYPSENCPQNVHGMRMPYVRQALDLLLGPSDLCIVVF